MHSVFLFTERHMQYSQKVNILGNAFIVPLLLEGNLNLEMHTDMLERSIEPQIVGELNNQREMLTAIYR